jgi:N-acyl-L-homoserine lactone synthetase
LKDSSKEVKRTVVVDCYASKRSRKALREIEDAYRGMLKEMVEYALEHGASQSTLHKVFYERFKRRFPWLPTRIVKGAYRDALRRASPSES